MHVPSKWFTVSRPVNLDGVVALLIALGLRSSSSCSTSLVSVEVDLPRSLPMGENEDLPVGCTTLTTM